DSGMLISYGLRKEWELARALGISTDASGYSYSDAFESYLGTQADWLRQLTVNRYTAELDRFAAIIQQTTGRKPANDEPIDTDTMLLASSWQTMDWKQKSATVAGFAMDIGKEYLQHRSEKKR